MLMLGAGRYALPPDYNTRMEKEKSRAEKEAEAREAKMKAQFPGMFPGPLNMGLGPMARPPLGLTPGIRPPLMMPGVFGLGMRPPMIGMPMGPGMMVPGMMGGFNPNALPGRFGRDILGRDFAGPGGVGHSRVRYARSYG
ncbi:hypothetical protein NCC49_003114 [Naganishia albida]|nr:hypothetical protein NCC49_003114 [Naganishia albida]